jgi:hypothetical protein
VAVQEPPPYAQAPTAIDRIAAGVAVIGGLLSLAIAVTVTATVFGRNVLDEGIPGDFEYVQMGTALAVFAFCRSARSGAAISWWIPSPPPGRHAFATWSMRCGI